MSESSSAAPRQSWLAPGLWIAVVVYAAAFFLLMRPPMILAPPLQHLTGIFYGALLLIWPALWIAAAVVTWRGRWRVILPMLLAGAMIFFCFIVLVGPVLSVVWATSQEGLCTTEPTSGSVVRLSCRAGSDDDVTFEGREGSPFMWLVRNQP